MIDYKYALIYELNIRHYYFWNETNEYNNELGAIFRMGISMGK